MPKVDDYIDRMRELSSAPQILPELLRLARDVNSDRDRVVQLLSLDPALTAKVLHFSNAAAQGVSSGISSVEEAVFRLGMNRILRVVITAAGATALSAGQAGYGIHAGELWSHSVAAAVAAQWIARDRSEDELMVFTTALLHDIGKIVLGEVLEKDYRHLLEQTSSQNLSLLEAERELLGVDHAEVGGCLLRRWQFPEAMAAAVACHHDPATADNHAPLAATCYLGNLVACFLGYACGGNAFALRSRTEAFEILDLSDECLPHLLMGTFDQFERIQALVKSNTENGV